MLKSLTDEWSWIFPNKQLLPMKTTPCEREMKTVQLFVIKTEAKSSAICLDKSFQAWEIHRAGNAVKSKQGTWDSCYMKIVFLRHSGHTSSLSSAFHIPLRYILVIIMGKAIVTVGPLYSLKNTQPKPKPREQLSWLRHPGLFPSLPDFLHSGIKSSCLL